MEPNEGERNEGSMVIDLHDPRAYASTGIVEKLLEDYNYVYPRKNKNMQIDTNKKEPCSNCGVDISYHNQHRTCNGKLLCENCVIRHTKPCCGDHYHSTRMLTSDIAEYGWVEAGANFYCPQHASDLLRPCVTCEAVIDIRLQKQFHVDGGSLVQYCSSCADRILAKCGYCNNRFPRELVGATQVIPAKALFRARTDESPVPSGSPRQARMSDLGVYLPLPSPSFYIDEDDDDGEEDPGPSENAPTTIEYCQTCTNMRGRPLDYHSSHGRVNLFPNERLKVGIEIEKEDSRIKEDLKPIELLANTGWVVERDGSLSSEAGFEAISSVLPLMNKEYVDKNLESVKHIINANVKNNCGGHIHVSDTQRSPDEILADIRGYLFVLYSMYPSRIENSYSFARKFQDYRGSGHHQAMNMSAKTLEFRIFPSPKSVEVLQFRLELLRFMLNNPRRTIQEVIKDIEEESPFYDLLRTVFSEDSILKKLHNMIAYSSTYGEVDTEVIKKVTDKYMKKKNIASVPAREPIAAV